MLSKMAKKENDRGLQDRDYKLLKTIQDLNEANGQAGVTWREIALGMGISLWTAFRIGKALKAEWFAPCDGYLYGAIRLKKRLPARKAA